MNTPTIPPPFAAYQGKDSHAFICFAHKDAPVVYPDIKWLHETGVNIWYDEGISPGHLWRDEIADSIKKCSLFIVFLSKAAIESTNCRKEINFALEAGKPLLAIYLEDVILPSGLSLAISDVQGILRFTLPEDEYLRKVLTYIEERLGHRFKDAGVPILKSRKPRRNLRFVALIAFVLLVGAFLLTTTTRQPGSAPDAAEFSFAPREWVLLRFENHTDNTQLENSLETALRVALSESTYINLLSRSRVRDSLQRMGYSETTRVSRLQAQEIALREGVAAMVDASVEQEGNDYFFNMDVIDPKTGSAFFSQSSKVATKDELLPELSSLADTLRSTLGEPQEMIQERNVQLQKATTKNLDALRLYSNAVENVYTVSLEETLEQLNQAIALDPDFALAHAKIATYILAVDGDKAAAQSHFDAALSHIDRLSQRERLYAEASRSWLAPPEEMERRWKVLARLYPDEISAHHNLGAIRWEYFNDFSGAIRHFREALEIDPNNGGVLYYLGYCLLALGETEEAIWALEQANDLTGMTVGLADAYIVLEDYSLAEELLTMNMDLTPGEQIPRITRLVSLELDQGNFRTAYDLAAEGLRFATQVSAHRSAVGFSGAQLAISTQFDASQFDQALDSAVSLVLRLMEEQLFLQPPTRELALMGKLAVRNDRLSTARQLADVISEIGENVGNPLSQDYAGLLAAEISMADGNLETAIELLELIITSSNLFQAHEGLARAYAQLGLTEKALAQKKWIAEHKGQALVQKSYTMMGREMNLMDWQEATISLKSSP